MFVEAALWIVPTGSPWRDLPVRAHQHATGAKRGMRRKFALIEGLPAQIVLADTAYDANALRQVIADEGALAVILTIPGVHTNIHRISCSMPSAISSNDASASSGSSDASQHASRNRSKLSRLFTLAAIIL
jgi:hypothetical protein